jgi:hypothetical protein
MMRGSSANVGERISFEDEMPTNRLESVDLDAR